MDPVLSTFVQFVLVIFLMLVRTTNSAYMKEQCGFHSTNYSIEWAFEPQTRSVVFVLRTKGPPTNFSEGSSFLTGVGFGRENKIEFIGISDGMMLVSAETDSDGQLRMNTIPNNNVKTISVKKAHGGDIVAEFARLLNVFEENEYLSGCLSFYFPMQWTKVDLSRKTMFPIANATQRQICAIAENCRLDVNNLEEMSQVGKHRDGTVEFSQSVDISGKGDPCSFVGEQYDVKWSYNKGTDTVDFVMKQKPKMGQWWSAVGIGDNMSDMDIGVIFLDNGVPDGMSDYFSNSYNAPDKDSSQDWKFDKTASKWNDSLIELHFSRKITTDDAEKDRTMDGCVLFQFAANSGSYGDGKRIHKHEGWPDLYKACDLKKRCVRQKRESRTGGANRRSNNLPVVSHSIDGQNGSHPEIIEEHHQNQTNTVGADKAISLLMQSLGPKIVQTVEESEAERHKKNPDEEKGQKELISSTINGQKENLAELMPIAEKKQETETSTDINTTEGTYTTNAQSNEPKVQQIDSGVKGSPFSLNAFLGNQTDDNLSPVGESTTNNGINGAREESESNGTVTTEQARFGISQMLGDGENAEGRNGTDEAVQNAIGLTNETSTASSTTESNTVGSATNVSIPSATDEHHPEEQTPSESGTSILPLNNTILSTEGTPNETFASTSISIATEAAENNANNITRTNEDSQSEGNVTTGTSTISVTSGPSDQTVAPPATTSSSTESSTTISVPQQNNTEKEEATTVAESTVITTEESSTTTTATNEPSSTINASETTESEAIYSSSAATSPVEVRTQENRIGVVDGSNSVEEGQSPKTGHNASSEIQPTTDQPKEREIQRGNTDGIKLPVIKGKCDILRPDLAICKSYMENYLSRVKEWAEKHNEPMENQFGKACKLLAAVPHVPTLCCQIFAEKCSEHI